MVQYRLIDVDKVQAHLRTFAKAREWDQYHSPKNLAMALAGEVGELLEIFQWLTEEESRAISDDPQRRERVGEELADVLQYVMRIADLLEIDIDQALWAKLDKNESKYPVALAKGNAKKYTEFTE